MNSTTMAGDGLNLDQLIQAEIALSNTIRDYEKKMRVELQLKQSAAAMAKVHTDKRSKKDAEQQMQLANHNLEALSMDVLNIVSEYRHVAERLRATERWQLQAQLASMKGDAAPPMPPPRSETAAYRMSDSQRNTTELYRPTKRASIALVPPRIDSTFDSPLRSPPPVPSKPNLSRSSTASTLSGYYSYPHGPLTPTSMGPENPREEQLMERIRAQAEEIARKDAELGNVTGLLREAEEHLRRMQQHPPPLPPRSESELAKHLVAVVQQKEQLETQLTHAEKTINDMRRNSRDGHSPSLPPGEFVPKQDQFRAITLERDQLAARVAYLEQENHLLHNQQSGSGSTDPQADRIQQLEHEIVNLQEKVKVNERDLLQAHQRQQDNLNRIAMLESELRRQGYGMVDFDAVRRASEYKSRVEELEKQLEALQQRNSNLDEHTRHLAKMLEAQSTNLNSTPSDEALLIESLQAKVEAVENTLLTTKEHAERKRSALRAALEEAQEELKAVTSVKAQLEERLSASEQDWCRRIEEKDREISHIRGQLAQASPSVGPAADKYQAELEALRKDLQESREELERMKAETKEMETSWSDASRQQIEEYQSMLDSLQRKLSVLGPELERVQQENDDLRASLQNAAAATSAAEIEELKVRHKEEMEQFISSSAAKQLSLEVEIGQLKERIDELTKVKGEVEAQCRNLEKAKTDGESQNAAAIEAAVEAARESERKKWDEMMASLQMTIQALEDELRRIHAEMENCKAQLHDSKKLLDEAARRKEDLDKGTEALRRENDELQASHSRILMSLRADMETSQQELDTLRTERDDLVARRSELEKRLAEMENYGKIAKAAEDSCLREVETLRARLSEDSRRTKDLEESEARLREDAELLRKELEQIKAEAIKRAEETRSSMEELQSLRVERDDAVSQLAALKEKFEKLEREAMQAVSLHEANLKRLQKQITEAETHRDGGNAEISSLVSRLRDLELEKESTERELQEMKNSSLKHQAQVASRHTEEIQQLRELNTELQKQLENARSAAQSATREADSASQQLQREIGERIAALEKDKHTMEQTLSSIKEQLQQAKQENDDLRRRLEASQQHDTPNDTTAPTQEEQESLQDLIVKNMSMAIDLADKEREVEDLSKRLRREMEEKQELVRRLDAEAKKGTSWWG